ncbi:hypothetical protein CBS147326_8404 [Penicillium roqueforti]|nr:hypothetical protein CBS147326_8404 [Penicillium roqueforti]
MKCLLGLQQGGALDPRCPNVEAHSSSSHNDRHPINAEVLVKIVQAQLGEDLDHNCTPIGSCGSYGAPFKVTCAAYGYTIIGKGTTSRLWKVVSREAEIYRILQRAQGSSVPVFLGAINLAKIYFLHGAGEIRHMLLDSVILNTPFDLSAYDRTHTLCLAAPTANLRHRAGSAGLNGAGPRKVLAPEWCWPLNGAGLSMVLASQWCWPLNGASPKTPPKAVSPLRPIIPQGDLSSGANHPPEQSIPQGSLSPRAVYPLGPIVPQSQSSQGQIRARLRS